jgi:hypothetical protein
MLDSCNLSEMKSEGRYVCCEDHPGIEHESDPRREDGR